jgi:hypothetical protein
MADHTALIAARSEPNRKARGRNVKCSDGSKRGLDQDPLSLAGFGVYEIGNSQSSVLVGPLAHALGAHKTDRPWWPGSRWRLVPIEPPRKSSCGSAVKYARFELSWCQCGRKLIARWLREKARSQRA